MLEIKDDFDSDTYRAVYTTRCPGAIYVLHVFRKKSSTGIKTAQKDIDVIRRRLRRAEIDYATRRPEENSSE